MKNIKAVEVESIYETNYRNIIETLRQVADNLESGEYGKAISCAIVVRMENYSIEAFGLGLGDIDTSITLFEQGKAKLIRILDKNSERNG